MIIKYVSPNAANLMTATRAIGYSFEAALADIIDNSIGKAAKEINVNFNSINSPYLAIIDDGCGMDSEELVVAMKYGSQGISDYRETNDLGRFGLGLKMASLSQCRKLTVISKKEGIICAAKWDLDYIEKVDNWALQTFTEHELVNIPHIQILNEQASGTIVLWEDFDRIADATANIAKVFDEKIDLARDHIALVFHRFIGELHFSRHLKIYFNNVIIEEIDPFMQDNTATQKLTEEVVTIEGQNILVKPFILPYLNKLSVKDKRQLGYANDLRRSQGFYVYRNKRLIIWGTWFRLIKQYELNKLARIRVDIPNTLDHVWNIDIKKSTASLPDLIKKPLLNIVNRTIPRSERVYTYRGRRSDKDDLIHIWNRIDDRGTFQYLINRDFQAYKILEANLDEDSIMYLDSFIKIIEDAFPYSAVYCDLAKNEANTKEIVMEDSQVYKIAEEMIAKIETIGGTKEFIESLEKIDFFIKYPNVINSIRKDYKHD